MRCEEARQALGPEPGPRPATPGSAGAFAHVQQCADCERFFARQRNLTQRLRRLSSTPAPRALRERVEHAITQDVVAMRAPGRRGAWLAGGGVLVATAAALVLILGAPKIPDRVAQPLVEHASQTTLEAPFEGSGAFTATSDHRQLYRWFTARVDYAVNVPQIDDAKLMGGRVVELGGQRVAAVIYMYRNHTVTYYPLSSGEVMGSPVDWDKILAQSADGYELAMWQEQGRARAVVAAMSRGDLMSFAEECRAKALGAI